MRKPRHFYVYVITNNPRSHVLYTGITGDLPRRVFEHKNKLSPGFTSRYNLTRRVAQTMAFILLPRVPRPSSAWAGVFLG
jgi:predicted GIY-YIG superfamily endonuclease